MATEFSSRGSSPFGFPTKSRLGWFGSRQCRGYTFSFGDGGFIRRIKLGVGSLNSGWSSNYSLDTWVNLTYFNAFGTLEPSYSRINDEPIRRYSQSVYYHPGRAITNESSVDFFEAFGFSVPAVPVLSNSGTDYYSLSYLLDEGVQTGVIYRVQIRVAEEQNYGDNPTPAGTVALYERSDGETYRFGSTFSSTSSDAYDSVSIQTDCTLCPSRVTCSHLPEGCYSSPFYATIENVNVGSCVTHHFIVGDTDGTPDDDFRSSIIDDVPDGTYPVSVLASDYCRLTNSGVQNINSQLSVQSDSTCSTIGSPEVPLRLDIDIETYRGKLYAVASYVPNLLDQGFGGLAPPYDFVVFKGSVDLPTITEDGQFASPVVIANDLTSSDLESVLHEGYIYFNSQYTRRHVAGYGGTMTIGTE